MRSWYLGTAPDDPVRKDEKKAEVTDEAADADADDDAFGVLMQTRHLERSWSIISV